MDVGLQMVFASHGWDGISDGQVYDEEIRLARLADELGFDVLWAVEHHFFDYSFCPDNAQFLAYLAGVVSHAEVGTALEVGKLDGHQKRLPAVIVPLSHYDPKKTRPQS